MLLIVLLLLLRLLSLLLPLLLLLARLPAFDGKGALPEETLSLAAVADGFITDAEGVFKAGLPNSPMVELDGKRDDGRGACCCCSNSSNSRSSRNSNKDLTLFLQPRPRICLLVV